MKLLTNEKTLVSSNGNKIILTDHRIQMTDKALGQAFTISIFLENISSIEIKYKSNIMLLILGGLAIIGGGILGLQPRPNNLFMSGVIVGIILIAIWWFTRKHIISITPNGGASLDFMVQGMKEEQINDFVHNVSQAKLTRMNALHKV